MAYTPAFIAFDPIIGVVKMQDVDPAGPGVGALPSAPRNIGYWEVIRAYDPILGRGEFVYAKNNSGGTINPGTVVQFAGSQDSNNAMILGALAWAGTANSGIPLGVAVSTVANNNWGWYQVGGNAVANTTGTITANAGVYFASSGTLQSAAVASKQMLNAQATTANNVNLGSGASLVALVNQAVVLLERPGAQGAIT